MMLDGENGVLTLLKLGAPSVLGAPSASLSMPSKASVMALRSAKGGTILTALLSITDDTDDTDNDHWILTQVQLRTQPTTNSWQAHEKARLRLCHSLAHKDNL